MNTDRELLYDTAMLAGEIMLESGAETYRVEDTMQRMLELSGMESINVISTTTGIFATLEGPGQEPIAGARRIRNRSSNLYLVSQVNEISREMCSGLISVEEARNQLLKQRGKEPFSPRTVAICSVLAVMGFSILFGGGLREFFGAGIAGLAMVLLGELMRTRVDNGFVRDAVKSFVLAVAATIFCRIVPETTSEVVIISAMMPLVPGVPIINGIRDTLQGDYMSGGARIMEAFVMAISIAVGVGAGLAFTRLLWEVLPL